jgi:hypothetical protein
MLTCDTLIDGHGLKPKLTLIFHGFRHGYFGQLCLSRRGDQLAGCVKYANALSRRADARLRRLHRP